MRQHFAHGPQKRQQLQGTAILRAQGFRLAQEEPQADGNGEHQKCGADAMPTEGPDQPRADGRGKGGHQGEDHDNERRDLRHFTSRETVADDRHGDNPRPGRAKALQHPRHQKRFKCRCHPAQHRAQKVEKPTADNHRASSKGIRQRSGKEGADPQPDDEVRHDQLCAHRRLWGQIRRDLSHGRQHRVDAEGHGGHQHGHEGNEFMPPKRLCWNREGHENSYSHND